ncbi:bifunctional DNA primase/polymerase [Streptomyces sp. NPDC127092]|uniref:bifunctional DNA primase/polymerase n=1 Tax=Streptomyces sp. NPDC127092 TaxID=3347135 RepID=UPI003654531A
MTTWLRDETTPYDIFRFLRDPDEERHQTARVTEEGAAWLASATARPDHTLAVWQERPAAPAALPCGTAFDVVNVEPIFGRRMLDRLWAEGPGSGPIALHRGRMLLFAAPGTAQRLPSLLDWEEWGDAVPRPLCHGVGDAVTVPPLAPTGPDAQGPRWVVAPDTRKPWLPGPEVLLWACVRAVRMVSRADVRVSIFASADPDANVYDVSRRR